MNKKILLDIFSDMRENYFYNELLFDEKYYGQYHISSYILCMIHVGNDFENGEFFINDIKKCLYHLRKQLGIKRFQTNADFSLEPICLAHYYTESVHVKEVLEEFLLGFNFILEVEINAKAVDYYLLRYFNVLYYKKILKSNVLLREEVNKVLKVLEKSDGILFDSIIFDKGFPDLAYHSRNLQIISSCYFLLNDSTVENILHKAFEFVRTYSSSDGRFCIYGRTSDLVYGYASLIMAIYLSFEPEKDRIWSSIVCRFMEKYIDDENCNLHLIPANGFASSNSRFGYDSYVYPMIYKTFSLSRLFCALNSKQSYKKLLSKTRDDIKGECAFDPSSGFIKVLNDSYEIIMNVFGHQDAPIRGLDNRCMPFFPYHYSSIIKIPSVPFKTAEKLPVETLLDKISRIVEKRFFDYRYNKLKIGYIPTFIDGKNQFVISGCCISYYNQNSLTLQVKNIIKYGKKLAREKSVEVKNNDFCIVEIEFKPNLKLSFTFDRKYKAQYQISHFLTDKLKVVGNKLFINGCPILEFSSEVILIKKIFSLYDSVSGIVKVSALNIQCVDQYYSVTYI